MASLFLGDGKLLFTMCDVVLLIRACLYICIYTHIYPYIYVCSTSLVGKHFGFPAGDPSSTPCTSECFKSNADKTQLIITWLF